MQLLKDHSWRTASLKQKRANSLEAYWAPPQTQRTVVLRQLAKVSSGIFNLWCHITLSQTLNQLLSPRIEIQIRILISQPDKKTEMLMIYWRQEVYKHRWFAPASTHPEALTGDCRGHSTRAHLRLLCQGETTCRQHTHHPVQGREEARKHLSKIRKLPICHFLTRGCKAALTPCSPATGMLLEREESCFFQKMQSTRGREKPHNLCRTTEAAIYTEGWRSPASSSTNFA